MTGEDADKRRGRIGKPGWDPSRPAQKRSRGGASPGRLERDGRPRGEFDDGQRGGDTAPHHRRAPRRSHSATRVELEDRDTVLLFGLHPVEAALRNPARTIKSLFLTENAENRLAEAVRTRMCPVTRVTPRELDKRLGSDTVHQGALIEAEPLDEPDLEDLIARSAHGPVVVLDQVTDPHNVGAVLRSAAAFGASGLLLTRRNSPPLSGVLAKSASGALELVPVHLAGNLARALEALKDGGMQVIGLDGQAQCALSECDFSRPTAIVLGAEGKGLRKLTAETCSLLCAIETADVLGSLNVSNAAAVTLHTALMGRRRNA